MSLIDSYYRFERKPDAMAKTRRDLITFFRTYEPLHKANRSSEVCLYLSDAGNINSRSRRRPRQRISDPQGNHISAIYHPEPEMPEFGYGDVKGTQDALLFIFSPDTTRIEILVAKGKGTVVQNLFDLLCDGELENEIRSLRMEAGQMK